MAPKSSRRPGFSRRAQYSLFASYVIAVAGVLIGLLLVLTARIDPRGHAVVQGVFTDLTSPITSAGRAAVRTVQDGFGNVSAYFDAASKNRAMEKELAEARRKLVQGQIDAAENKRLKKLVQLRSTILTGSVTGRLIGSTGSISRRYATFSAGQADGVENGQPVRSVDGLVGRIVQAGQVSSRVLLITDGGNLVPVKRISDGLPASAVGIGNGLIELRALSSGVNPFKAGDIFATSGSGGIYHPGTPVAVIVRAGRDSSIGRPLADPGQLDFAIVEPAFVPPASAPPPLSGTDAAPARSETAE